jgi:hypothetical protein
MGQRLRAPLGLPGRLPPPTSPSATPTSGTAVTVAWTDTNQGVSPYRVERSPTGTGSWATAGTTAAGATSFGDTGLSPVTLYYYRVIATSPADSAPSSVCSATTLSGSPPSAPTSPGAVAVPNVPHEVALFLDGTSVGEDAVTWERSTTSGSGFATLKTLGGGENLYLDRSCDPATTYYYRAKLSNANGGSSYTSEVSATTGAAYSANKVVDPSSPSASSVTATTATFSFTDNATGNRAYFIERLDPGSLEWKVVKGNVTATSYTDVGLTPGVTYYYRVQGRSTATINPSNYTTPVSVTMPSRTAGYPVEPKDVLAVPAGPTSVTVTWTDQTGGAAQHEVFYCAWNAALNNTLVSAGTVSAGVTTLTVTGLTAETPYRFRVKSKNGTGSSDYGVPLRQEQLRMHGPECATCTSSALNGSGTTYNVGPGQTYTTLRAFFNAVTPGPGDVINLYPTVSGGSVVPDSSCVLFSSRGLPGARITLRGQPDSGTGLYPVIDVTGGTATSAFATRAAAVGSTFAPGALWLGRKSTHTFGYSPGYIDIKNIEFKGAYAGGSYDRAGTAVNWDEGSAGIYVEAVEDMAVESCTIDGNGNGIFAAAHSEYDRPVLDMVVRKNYVWGNSGTTPTGTPSHNTYIEGVRTLYEGNHYGPVRSGGQGIGLKERSTGVVIRFNLIEGGNHQVEHAEAQNHSDLSGALDIRLAVYIYGNVTYCEPGNANSPYWLGGDQGNLQVQPKCVYYLYHNTVVLRNDQTGTPSAFKEAAVKVSSPSNLLDARDNIFDLFPNTPGHTPSDFGLGDSSLSGADGGNYNAFFGKTWASNGYLMTIGNSNTFTGHANGTGNVINGASADPGFTDQANGDYHLQGGSACVGVGTALPARVLAAYPPNKQYHPGTAPSVVDRSTYGAGADLGAYQQGVV